MIKFLKQNEIKSVQTTTHAHTVERFIRTFKDNLYRRLDALKQTYKDWFIHIDRIIKKYNSTEHSTIQIKPNEAGEKKITFGLAGIYQIMRNEIANILILNLVIWLEFI